jgi:molybdopterin-guanine dinucleotide biosynthesis protein A
MGTDKAFIEMGGRWLISSALAALAEASQRLIVGGTDSRLERAASTADAQHVADRWPGEGPLGAVATALGQAQHPVTVILPCDLPAISPTDVTELVQAVYRVLPAAVPSAAIFADQRRHYLPLAIHSEAAALAKSLFESGRRAVASLLDEVTVVDVPASPTAVADIDSPEDL